MSCDLFHFSAEQAFNACQQDCDKQKETLAGAIVIAFGLCGFFFGCYRSCGSQERSSNLQQPTQYTSTGQVVQAQTLQISTQQPQQPQQPQMTSAQHNTYTEQSKCLLFKGNF